MKIKPLISKVVVPLAICALLLACNGGPPPAYDLILRGGTIYDGSGSEPYVGDLAIRGDEVAERAAHADGHRGRAGHVDKSSGTSYSI